MSAENVSEVRVVEKIAYSSERPFSAKSYVDGEEKRDPVAKKYAPKESAGVVPSSQP